MSYLRKPGGVHERKKLWLLLISYKTSQSASQRGIKIVVKEDIKHGVEHKIEDEKIQLMTIGVQLKISLIYYPPQSIC